jgi:hypothetical protein
MLPLKYPFKKYSSGDESKVPFIGHDIDHMEISGSIS